MIKKHLSLQLSVLHTVKKLQVKQRGRQVVQKVGRLPLIAALLTLPTLLLLACLMPLKAQNRRGPKVSAPASGAAKEGALKKYVITCPVDIRVNEPVAH